MNAARPGYVARMRINTADSRVAAQAVHDLGAALWFGGSVMGVAGVNKSGADLRDGVEDKVRVAESAWRRFAPVQWLGIGAVMVAGSRLTWESKGRLAVQHGLGRAGAAQAAVAVAGAAATGFAAWSGTRIGQLTERANERGRAVRHEGRDDPECPDPARGRRLAAPPARRAVPGARPGRREHRAERLPHPALPPRSHGRRHRPPPPPVLTRTFVLSNVPTRAGRRDGPRPRPRPRREARQPLDGWSGSSVNCRSRAAGGIRGQVPHGPAAGSTLK